MAAITKEMVREQLKLLGYGEDFSEEVLESFLQDLQKQELEQKEAFSTPADSTVDDKLPDERRASSSRRSSASFRTSYSEESKSRPVSRSSTRAPRTKRQQAPSIHGGPPKKSDPVAMFHYMRQVWEKDSFLNQKHRQSRVFVPVRCYNSQKP